MRGMPGESRPSGKGGPKEYREDQVLTGTEVESGASNQYARHFAAQKHSGGDDNFTTAQAGR